MTSSVGTLPARLSALPAQARHFVWWAGATVCGLVALLITVRFFTERVPVLPRFFNAIDFALVPALLPLCLLHWVRQRRPVLRGAAVASLCALFVVLWAVAWLANAGEVHWLGAVLLLAGLLLPVVFYLELLNLGLDRRFVRQALVVYDGLLLFNLVVGTFDALAGLGTGAHDFVFGTFGVNQNQMAFFMASMSAYRLARLRYLGWRLADLLLLGWSLAVFVLCAFQTLWVIMAVAVVLVFLVVGRLTRRMLGLALLGLAVPVVVVAVLPFGRFDFAEVYSNYADDIPELGKVQLLRAVPVIWSERPGAVWWGLGPGAFNSRAFRSIAIIPGQGGATDVAAALIPPFYHSPMANRFIIPYFRRGIFRISGPNTDAPFTSYVSVPLETGLPGGAVIFGIYGLLLAQLARSMRGSPDAHTRALAAWAMLNLLMLLGIAVVDNFLEVTRYTLQVWFSVALWRLHRTSA